MFREKETLQYIHGSTQRHSQKTRLLSGKKYFEMDDIVTLHVPLTDATRNFGSAAGLNTLEGGYLLSIP
jgi:phosphoglycerate dehydrogenase-like enzyme